MEIELREIKDPTQSKLDQIHQQLALMTMLLVKICEINKVDLSQLIKKVEKPK